VGIVIFNPQAPKGHRLPFLGQEGTKFEMLLFYQKYNPLSIQIHGSTGEVSL
jgi:hypothetical protein